MKQQDESSLQARIDSLLDQRRRLLAALERIARSEDINRRTLMKWAEEGLAEEEHTHDR